MVCVLILNEEGRMGRKRGARFRGTWRKRKENEEEKKKKGQGEFIFQTGPLWLDARPTHTPEKFLFIPSLDK